MKNLVLILLICSNFVSAFSQRTLMSFFDFENNNWDQDSIWIDTLSNPNNAWQIGKPDKSIFQQAYSQPNAIITDLDSSYPINDTSSFYIIHIADAALCTISRMWIDFESILNSDSLSDYGKIEFSPDNGKSWLNTMNDSVHFYKNNISMSGNSDGWVNVHIDFHDFKQDYNFTFGDTVLWKFTFISDSTQTFKDGWMIDNIKLFDVFESIEEDKVSLISIYPSPASDEISIHYSNFSYNTTGFIYDISGHEIRKFEITGVETAINISEFDAGIYFIRVITGDEQVIKKIIKE